MPPTHLPVDIDPIESQVLEKLHSRSRKLLPTSRGASRACKLLPVRPPSNRQQGFHVPVLLLQQIHLLDAPVNVVPLVIPRIVREMLVRVSVGICQDNLSRRLDIGEGIKDVGEMLRDQVLGVVSAFVDGLVAHVSQCVE